MKETLIRLECSLLEKDTRSSRAQLNALIADDFLEFGSSGQSFGKAEVLAWLPEENNIQYTATDFILRELAPDLGQLLYKAVFRDSKGKCHYSLRCSLWKKTHANWQMIFHQGTPCPSFEMNYNNAEDSKGLHTLTTD